MADSDVRCPKSSMIGHFNYLTDTNYSEAINLIRYTWGGADVVLYSPATLMTFDIQCSCASVHQATFDLHRLPRIQVDACANHALAGDRVFGKQADIHEQVSMGDIVMCPTIMFWSLFLIKV